MKNIYLILLLLISYTAQAQIWDGNTDGDGDNTSWDDPLNWENDMVPIVNDTVHIGESVTITGTITNIPARITIENVSTVDFAISMDIGDGIEIQHSIIVNMNCALIFSGPTFNINPSSGKGGINIFGSSTNASITINSGTTVNIIDGNNGLNIANTSATVTNNGTISIVTSKNGINHKKGSFINNGTIALTNTETGIKTTSADANFTNEGTITITTPTKDGIQSKGPFSNGVSGQITITEAEENALDIDENIFTNDGTIDITMSATASASSTIPGIAVGSSTTAATFNNTSNNSLNVDGGTGANGRGMQVYTMGTMSNTGTISFTGGDPKKRILSQGSLINEIGATIKLNTDGRMEVNNGTFTNNGLLESDRTSPAINTGLNGTSTNNAFYEYGLKKDFSNGTGSITDNGIDLKDPVDIDTDFNGMLSATIVPVQYAYSEGGSSAGFTDVAGVLTLPLDRYATDPATLTIDAYPSKEITISNFDATALPIELIEFTAKRKHNVVILDWTTASEINSDYIAVERSSDGFQFSEIYRILNNGDSHRVKHYSYEDKKITSGNNYYRLYQQDTDGKGSYSPIRVVQVSIENTQTPWTIYPTIVSNGKDINIRLNDKIESKTLLHMYNMNGTMIHSEQLIEQNTQLSSLHLNKGQYFINVTNDNNTTTKIFIIL